MAVPYKNPISSVQVSTPLSVSRTSVFGTNFSNLNVGGYMEVYNLSDLSLTLTATSYPSLIQLSANTIPIRYTKGNGTFLSPDYLTLNSDNISSGRRRLGMMVYVHETDKVYQYVIPNYDTLWNNLSGLTGFSSVTYSDYTTVINSRSSAGQSFISGWTSSNIEGVGGYSSANANWRIFQSGSSSGGTSSGAYLPLSGGTVFGNTIFTSGLTANTLNINNYIDFNTGTTNPSSIGGRVFYDNTSKSLSYYDIGSSVVPIAMGQQLYTRVWNTTGVQIDKGKVITITGTSNNLPSARLAVNNHSVGSPRPIGVAAENIPNGTEGLVLTNGILSGITLNTFANGAVLYLSATIPGEYVDSTSSLPFSARTNEIGYVLQTGTTTGKIYININNEDSNLTLTDIERNILEGNFISSGVYEYTGMTQGTGATINVAKARGWIVKNTYEFATLPDVINLYYPGGTNIPITNLATADATFILINSASTLVQQTSFPTPQQRRENIFLGKVVHPSRNSITSINQTVDFDVSPMAALRDLWTPLKLINQGIIVSPHSTTLEINTSAGVLWGNGVGWTTNQQNPNSVSISGTSPTTFQYRTRLGPLTGGTVPTGNTTTIAPGFYDNNGVVTAVGGGSNSSTNQRVFLFPTGLVRIQLGQQVYGTLAAAVAGSQTEQFNEYSLNRENGILIGIISVNKNATNLSLAAQAVFNLVSKFGEVLGGTGGLSTTTLQQAYDNSATPEIVTSSAEGALSIKNGTGNADNVSNLFEGQNTAGSITSFIRADGLFSGSSISTPGFTSNTNGLTATTISATTYQNLPTDIRITGATYSNNTFTYRNNTGGTFNVLFNTVTGLTANTLTVTGNTDIRAFTGTSGVISGTGQNILTVIGSGNSTTSPIFSVQGSQGELFSVTDSLTGSLFSVNDISGLPILEVFSDNTTLMGSYLAPSLNTTARVVLTAGTNTVYSIPVSAYTGAFFDYTVASTGTTGVRAGTVTSVWSGSTAEFTDVSTNDIGSTTGVTFSVTSNGTLAQLRSSATTSGWIVKTIIRSI